MSPPEASGLRERKRAETRQRLERAALSLFLAHGFEETTIDDIAEAARISRAASFTIMRRRMSCCSVRRRRAMRR